MPADRHPSIEARLRSAVAHRDRLTERLSAPAMLADARCGDADARHARDELAEQLREAEALVTDIEAQLATVARGAAA